MSREDFFDSLRLADRMLLSPRVGRDQRGRPSFTSVLESSDHWLNKKAVEGFDPADFADWPEPQQRKLEKEVEGFLAIAGQIPPNKLATKTQSERARRHLDSMIELVRRPLLEEWLGAQKTMMGEAAAAAKSKKWYVEWDEKELVESLLGTYKAPRLRLRSLDREVILNPIARFGTGRRGIVDLVVMPTYETAYYIVLKDGEWRILSPRGNLSGRPFSASTFLNTITRIPLHHYA